MRKNIVILGSTGSIGTQTIEVVKRYREYFTVVALSAHQNSRLLKEQVEQLNVDQVAVTDPRAADQLASELEGQVSIRTGLESLPELASLPEADLVVNALVGSVGLESTLAALEHGKTVALANKESLVAGGELVKEVLIGPQPVAGTRLVPVDSEHNAIFQCLIGEDIEDVAKILLTGSGGPFRSRPTDELEGVTVAEALAHPRWAMGKKVTIDSATLMNKGLEVIEAHVLFGVSYDQIDVVIHPQSIVHSMVEFKDGSVKAQLGPTDMRLPILHALGFPKRLGPILPGLDFYTISQLSFEKPDERKFPCLRLALEAGKLHRTYPAVLNVANEEAVQSFLANRLSFTGIADVIEKVLSEHTPKETMTLETVKEAEQWARLRASELIEKQAPPKKS